MERKKAFAAASILLIGAFSLFLAVNLWTGEKEASVRAKKISFLDGPSETTMGGYNDQTLEGPNVTTIVLAYCCATEEPTFKEIIPAFKKFWKEKTGQEVRFVTGWTETGFDSLATVVNGKPVQVGIIASAIDPQSKGYSATKWQNTPNKAVVTKSLTVFLVRKGNPKNIRTFEDLARPGVKIIHSKPNSSGGGLWAVYGIYGAGMKLSEKKYGKPDTNFAYDFMEKVEKNVIKMPDMAKNAGDLFAKGEGDVLITSENKSFKRLAMDNSLEMIVPPGTVEYEWLAYKIDKNIAPAQQEVVNAFIDFLFSGQAQEGYAKFGFRSADPAINAKYDSFAPIKNPFNIEYLGGPVEAKEKIIKKLWMQVPIDDKVLNIPNVNLTSAQPAGANSGPLPTPTSGTVPAWDGTH